MEIATEQDRRKRSGWPGFGRTNIEGESGRVHIAAACRRGCDSDRYATLYIFAKERLGNFNSGPG